MKLVKKFLFISCIGVFIIAYCNKGNKESVSNGIDRDAITQKKVSLAIIVGSTRQGRSSDKIAALAKRIADQRDDVDTHIIDLRDYALPFLNDEVAPASRTVITDPVTQKWSDVINKADAFIIVSPEYNAGYPGVLKNALDSLYKEWNNKRVGFIVYSGGPSGGASALGQLRQVAGGLSMIPVDASVKIPESWKALDTKGRFVKSHHEQEISLMIDQIIAD